MVEGSQQSVTLKATFARSNYGQSERVAPFLTLQKNRPVDFMRTTGPSLHPRDGRQPFLFLIICDHQYNFGLGRIFGGPVLESKVLMYTQPLSQAL
jgi:hypothetical protein